MDKVKISLLCVKNDWKDLEAFSDIAKFEMERMVNNSKRITFFLFDEETMVQEDVEDSLVVFFVLTNNFLTKIWNSKLETAVSAMKMRADVCLVPVHTSPHSDAADLDGGASISESRRELACPEVLKGLLSLHWYQFDKTPVLMKQNLKAILNRSLG